MSSPACSIVVRILMDFCRRIPTWTPLGQWVRMCGLFSRKNKMCIKTKRSISSTAGLGIISRKVYEQSNVTCSGDAQDLRGGLVWNFPPGRLGIEGHMWGCQHSGRFSCTHVSTGKGRYNKQLSACSQTDGPWEGMLELLLFVLLATFDVMIIACNVFFDNSAPDLWDFFFFRFIRFSELLSSHLRLWWAWRDHGLKTGEWELWMTLAMLFYIYIRFILRRFCIFFDWINIRFYK